MCAKKSKWHRILNHRKNLANRVIAVSLTVMLLVQLQSQPCLAAASVQSPPHPQQAFQWRDGFPLLPSGQFTSVSPNSFQASYCEGFVTLNVTTFSRETESSSPALVDKTKNKDNASTTWKTPGPISVAGSIEKSTVRKVARLFWFLEHICLGAILLAILTTVSIHALIMLVAIIDALFYKTLDIVELLTVLFAVEVNSVLHIALLKHVRSIMYHWKIWWFFQPAVLAIMIAIIARKILSRFVKSLFSPGSNLIMGKILHYIPMTIIAIQFALEVTNFGRKALESYLFSHV